jgi:hypothetical protein
MENNSKNKYNTLLFISSLAILSACSSKTDKQVAKWKNSELPDSTVLSAKQQQGKNSVIKKDIVCARGQAEPIIKKKYFPNAIFALQPDSITAIERVSFKNGDKLVITNWGCESYVLTFRFETSKFKADTSNLKYWYAAAAKLMNEVVPRIDAPLDIKEGVRAINNYAVKNTKRLRLRTELNFGGDETIRFATLDTIAKMQKNRTAVIMSFTAGLL